MLHAVANGIAVFVFQVFADDPMADEVMDDLEDEYEPAYLVVMGRHGHSGEHQQKERKKEGHETAHRKPFSV